MDGCDAVQLPFEDNQSEPPFSEGHESVMKCSQPNKPWFEYWFAAHVSVRLFWLPIVLRFRTLPEPILLVGKYGLRSQKLKSSISQWLEHMG